MTVACQLAVHAGASAGPKILRKPSHIRYAAPAYFTMLKASAEDSSRTDKPSAAARM